MSFDKEMQEVVQKQIIASIRKADLVQVGYGDRFKMPDSFLSECWELVNKEKLKQALACRLEQELVERIVNHMASEIATDIKQVLSVKERREAIRHVVRENIDSLTKV